MQGGSGAGQNGHSIRGPREGALCLATVPPEAWILECWSGIIHVWFDPDDTYTATLKLMSVADIDTHFSSLFKQALETSQSFKYRTAKMSRCLKSTYHSSRRKDKEKNTRLRAWPLQSD